MCNIRDEMSFNVNLLKDDYQPRHQGLLNYVENSIKQIQDDPESSTSIELIDRQIIVDNLRSTAWTLALETGYLLHVDFKFATKVAAVYELQEKSYKKTFEGVVETLFTILKADEKVTLQQRKELFIVLREWYLQEQYLLSKYAGLMQQAGIKDMACED